MALVVDNTAPMFDDLLRARLASIAAPAARRCVAAGVTPNMLTRGGVMVGIAAAVAVACDQRLLAAVLWLVNRLMDGLDGLAARETGQASALGGFWDITLDMVSYSGMILGFAIAYPHHGVLWPSVLAGYILAITTTLALSAAADRLSRTVAPGNRTFQFTRGLAESGETTIVYLAWLAWPAWIGPIGWAWCGLLLASAIQRAWLAQRSL